MPVFSAVSDLTPDEPIFEDKDHTAERLNFSPDYGDSAILTFAINMGVLMELKDDDEDDTPN